MKRLDMQDILNLDAENFVAYIERNDVTLSKLREYARKTSEQGRDALNEVLQELEFSMSDASLATPNQQWALAELERAILAELNSKPKANRKNQDTPRLILTQDQIAWLFETFKTCKIIQPLSKTALAPIINTLGGYNGDSSRQALSRVLDTGNDPESKKALKDALQAIIEKLQ